MPCLFLRFQSMWSSTIMVSPPCRHHHHYNSRTRSRGARSRMWRATRLPSWASTSTTSARRLRSEERERDKRLVYVDRHRHTTTPNHEKRRRTSSKQKHRASAYCVCMDIDVGTFSNENKGIRRVITPRCVCLTSSITRTFTPMGEGQNWCRLEKSRVHRQLLAMCL